MASLGDLQEVALAGLWVWSQRASKAILAANLLEEPGRILAQHFSMSLIVWYPPTNPAVSDGPKKPEKREKRAIFYSQQPQALTPQ